MVPLRAGSLNSMACVVRGKFHRWSIHAGQMRRARPVTLDGSEPTLLTMIQIIIDGWAIQDRHWVKLRRVMVSSMAGKFTSNWIH